MEIPARKTARMDAANGLQSRSEILDNCLKAIEQHQATVESCALKYPDFEELAFLLHAAEAVQRVQPVSMSVMSKNSVREQMLAHYRAQNVRAKAPQARSQVRWLRPLGVVMALIMFAFMGSFGLVRASAATLPGDSLYPVKRIAESIQVTLTSGDAHTKLLESLAETRLAEI